MTKTSNPRGYKSYDRALAQSAIINANPEAQALWHDDIGWRNWGVGELVGDGMVWSQLYVGQRGRMTTACELATLGWVSVRT